MHIIFLLSGQSRSSPFAHNKTNSHQEILDSYNNYIFTEQFKQLHKYKIYITTDDIHLENTINYFNMNNIGNIHLLEPNSPTDFYIKNINNKCSHINNYFEKYNNKDWSNHQKYDNSIHQHYKLLDCYNLYKNDYEVFNKKCDYIVRMRLDTKFTINILNVLQLFVETPQLKIVMDWDFFAIGKPCIMDCYCSGLDYNYGNYNYTTPIPDILPVMHDYNYIDKYRWTYAPERQLFEMIFEYCNNNNLYINTVIKNIYNFCIIIR